MGAFCLCGSPEIPTLLGVAWGPGNHDSDVCDYPNSATLPLCTPETLRATGGFLLQVKPIPLMVFGHKSRQRRSIPEITVAQLAIAQHRLWIVLPMVSCPPEKPNSGGAGVPNAMVAASAWAMPALHWATTQLTRCGFPPWALRMGNAASRLKWIDEDPDHSATEGPRGAASTPNIEVAPFVV